MLPWISPVHASTSARQIGPVNAHVYWVITRERGRTAGDTLNAQPGTGLNVVATTEPENNRPLDSSIDGRLGLDDFHRRRHLGELGATPLLAPTAYDARKSDSAPAE